MVADQKLEEVSIRAAITDSSLAVSIRSRAITAFDRLLGGLAGIPASLLEKVEARIRGRIAREAMVQGAAADRLKSAILNDEDVSPVIADIALSTRIAPVINKLRVAELAVGELFSDASHAEQEDTQEQQDVDQDWLNHFGAYAEKASSEGVRQLWAKVLAGEVRRIGSFSLSSLRLLSELDQKMATTFEREVQYRVNDKLILRPKIEEMHGERLESLTFLEEVGLLQTINAIGGISWEIQPNNNGIASLRERDFLLVMESQEAIKIPIIPLSRIGLEIVKILPPADPVVVLEGVGTAISEQVTCMDIHCILEQKNGRFRTSPVKTIKARPRE